MRYMYRVRVVCNTWSTCTGQLIEIRPQPKHEDYRKIKIVIFTLILVCTIGTCLIRILRRLRIPSDDESREAMANDAMRGRRTARGGASQGRGVITR